MPTEAEWEKAARGGLDGHHYPWESRGQGYERFISPERANYDASKKAGTTPVEAYQPNGYGLYDMGGNVWQWTWDRHKRYSESGERLVDPRGGDSGVFRVLRGGGWGLSARGLRCAYRSFWRPSFARGFQGFRLAGGQADAGFAELDEGGERGSRDEPPGEPPEESAGRASCLTVEVLPPESRTDLQSVQDDAEAKG